MKNKVTRIYKVEIEIPEVITTTKLSDRVVSSLHRLAEDVKNKGKLFSVLRDDDGNRIAFSKLIERRRPLNLEKTRRCVGCSEPVIEGEAIRLGVRTFLCVSCRQTHNSTEVATRAARKLQKDLGNLEV